LKLTFAQPLTTTEREALDALNEQYSARYSYLPPRVNQAASEVTWSFFGQFAVLVSFSLLSVCAVYYYLIRRNMLTRLVRFCFGQSRISVLRHLLIETLVVGAVCLLTGGLIALLVFTLFTGYSMTADNILFSGGIYLVALLLFSVVFGRKAIAGLHVSGLREEL
jgi:ABC-type multidrug transport system permease subunit